MFIFFDFAELLQVCGLLFDYKWKNHGQCFFTCFFCFILLLLFQTLVTHMVDHLIPSPSHWGQFISFQSFFLLSDSIWITSSILSLGSLILFPLVAKLLLITSNKFISKAVFFSSRISITFSFPYILNRCPKFSYLFTHCI